MKRFLLLLFLVISLGAWAQTAVQTNGTFTVLWDASSTFADGTPYLAGDVIAYLVYTSPYPGTAWVLAATVTTGTQAVLTFTIEGAYHVAVTIRRTTAAGLVQTGPATVSSASGVPSPWYVVYLRALGAPGNLRHL